MVLKQYSVVTRSYEALPRSKRLRARGATAGKSSGGGGSVTIMGGGDGHTHTNKATLDAQSMDTEGYLYLQYKPDGSSDSKEEKVKAGYADKAAHALNADNANKWNDKQFEDYLDQPLRKEDSVNFLKVIAQMFSTPDYKKGDMNGGAGAAVYKEGDSTVMEIDKLIVRKEASFNELTINQISFQLGETVFSAGGCTITKVGEGSDFYRCYYDNKEGNRYSGFQAGDYARCQQFDATNQVQTKYYWRLVVNVGDDYVDLSNADCDGTGIPATGDDIVQFGNRFEVARQSAVVISPYSGGSIVILSGVDSYSLVGKNYVGIGVDASTGKAYMYGYGDVLIGDRDKSGQYVEYKNGKLIIKADVTLGSDSDLSDVEAFAKLEQINDDLYLTPVEKRSLRQQINNIIDGEGTTLPYWAAIGYESQDVEWYQVKKGDISNGLSQDAWEGWWSSNIAGQDSARTIMQLYITVNRSTIHSFDLMFSGDSENYHDYLLVSRIGSPVEDMPEHSLTDITQQASTYSTSNILTKKYQLCKEDYGATFLQVMYRKDGSDNEDTDAGYFRIVPDTVDYWENGIQYLAADGSYPSAYAALTVLGLSEIRGELTARLEALINYIRENGEIWGENADATTSITEEFRIEVNRLFSRYYAYEAQCSKVISEAEASKALSNVEYLKRVFPNATLDVNGATLSLLLGVKDGVGTDSKIVAGLYGGGSDELNSDLRYNDEEHGVLMFFAGAKALNFAYEANTRIYADGTLFTNRLVAENADISGKISATSGIVGGFTITENDLTASTDNSSMLLSSYLIRYLSANNKQQVYLGTNTFAGSEGRGPMLLVNEDSIKGGTLYGIYISVSGAVDWLGSKGYNNAIHIANGDIYNASGVFYGLRPNVRIVTTSETLSKEDNIIYVLTSGSAITVTLPSGCPQGQMYTIRRLQPNTSGSITIRTVGGEVLVFNSSLSEAKATSESLTSYRAFELHYIEVEIAGVIKKCWIMNYLAV